MQSVTTAAVELTSPPQVSLPGSSASALADLTHIAMSLDALNCGAMLMSRQGMAVHLNLRLGTMLQRPRESLIGSCLTDWYLADDEIDVIRTMLANFEQSRETEFFLPQPDGVRLPVVISARPVGADGLLGDYAVVTFIDLSQQKLAENRLIEQNDYIGQLSDQVIQQATLLREYNMTLEERVRVRTAELHEAHMQTLFMLAIASEAKDGDTGAHVQRIRTLVQKLAEEMGIGPTDAERMGHSSVLHDVGKIHTPDVVLKKPGPLTKQERSMMQQHTLAGERILRPSAYFTEASRVARHHHENFDGTGYPDQLAGNDIPLEARIVHLADVYDALTHARVYKPAWEHAIAVAEIQSQREKMFDPAVVDAFMRLDLAGELSG